MAQTAQTALCEKLSELSCELKTINEQIEQADKTGIDELERSCLHAHDVIFDSLLNSKAKISPILLQAYTNIESEIKNARSMIHGACCGEDADCDMQLLLAEYELDFAVLAAKRAVYEAAKGLCLLEQSSDASQTYGKENERSQR